MIKRISIGIVVFAFIIGAVAIWIKTRPEETTGVLGTTNTNLTDDVAGKPDVTFGETLTSTPVLTATPTAIPTTDTNQKGPYTMQIDSNKQYEAIMKTSVGDITIAFNAKETPITVNNFIVLARKNFYNNTIFHRIINGFMIQGGDPTGTGTGGPGYKFDDEPFTGEYLRGTIAMANAGPNTNGSQFFIMHKDYPLPKNYVIFGKVIKGIEVVDKIATASTKPGGEGSSPVDPVKIISIEVTEQ